MPITADQAYWRSVVFDDTTPLFDLAINRMMWAASFDRQQALDIERSMYTLQPTEDSVATAGQFNVFFADAYNGTGYDSWPINALQAMVTDYVLSEVFARPSWVAGLPHNITKTSGVFPGQVVAGRSPWLWPNYYQFAIDCVLNDGTVGLNGGVANLVDPGTDLAKQFPAVADPTADSYGVPFRRLTIRKIRTTADAADTEGNDAADGMVARLVETLSSADDRIVHGKGDYAYDGGAGAWAATDLHPDVLDSATNPAGGSWCKPGCSDGRRDDLIGPWIWNELIAAYNLLYIVPRGTTTWNGCGTYGIDFRWAEGNGESPGVTFTDVKTDAEDMWDAAVRYGSDHVQVSTSPSEYEFWVYAAEDTGAEGSFTRGSEIAAYYTAGVKADLYGSYAYITAPAFAWRSGGVFDSILAAFVTSDPLPPDPLDGGTGITEAFDEFDGNGYGSASNDLVAVEQRQVTADGAPVPQAGAQYFTTFYDDFGKPNWPTGSVTAAAGTINTRARGANFLFITFSKYPFTYGTYDLAGYDAAPAITGDCPSDICWYQVTATPTCPGGANPLFADYSIVQVDKVCDVVRSGRLVSAPIDLGDGFMGKTYTWWVAGPTCTDVGGCPDLTESQLAALKSRLPIQRCPLSAACHKRITYVSEWSCEFATWHGEEGDQIPEYVNGSGTCADSDAPAPHDWEVTSFGDTGNPIATKEEDIGICDCDDAGSHYDPTFTEIADNRPSDPPFSGADLCPE